MIESVDSIKLAHQLNKQWELEDREEKLNIMLQVNTSHEEGSKIIIIIALDSIHVCHKANLVVGQRRALMWLSILWKIVIT